MTRYQVASPKLAGEKTWVFLSDLHNQIYGVNNCRLIDAVKKESPDLILIGGDMLVGKNGHSYETGPCLCERACENLHQSTMQMEIMKSV